jgi:hypothetical protein
MFATINGLQTLARKEDVEASLESIRKDVEKMKEFGIFNKEIENLLKTMLLNLSKIWASYNMEIANLYGIEANKYSSEIYSLETEEKLA